MNSQIRTDRLTLTPLTTNDTQFILELVNTEGWLQFIGDRNVHSVDDAIDYINRILAQQNIKYWVARVNGNNEAAGIVTWIKRAYLEYHDIGFAFLPAFVSKGYAYEATNAILKLVGDPAQPILSITKTDNLSAIKLLQKLGFRFQEEILVEKEYLLVYTLKNHS